MQTGYISFCDSIAFNIKSDKIKKKILDDINSISSIKIIQKHFDVLNKNHFKKLNDIPHLVSLKTNGNPYLLYLTKYNFTNLSIFIDKKIQPGYFLPRMIITYFQFNEELYNNTLFEGEMIKDKDGNWIFIINDLYIHKNKLLINHNILNRIEMIDNILNKQFNNDNNICSFNIKKYFKYGDLKYVIEEFSKKLNYTSRGIYFTPLYFKFKNILYNFDDSLINSVKKVKYQKNNEFLLMKDKRKITNTSNTSKSSSSNNNKDKNTVRSRIPVYQLHQQINQYSPISQVTNTPPQTNTPSPTNTQLSTFHIEKTDMPDVFNLFTYNENMKSYSKVDIAYIPNMKTSKFMRELFKNENIITKLKITCRSIVKNDNIKWIPINQCN